MTGAEIFAVVGGAIAWTLAIGLSVRAFRRAKAAISMGRAWDDAAIVLEEPEDLW